MIAKLHEKLQFGKHGMPGAGATASKADIPVDNQLYFLSTTLNQQTGYALFADDYAFHAVAPGPVHVI